MKKTLLVLAVLLSASRLHSEIVSLPKVGASLDLPDGWTLEEDKGKTLFHAPDQTGKIQAFNVKLPPNSAFDKVVEAYQEATFKNAASPRPGQKIEVLESGPFETAGGLKGYKGAFGYKDGANHQPEVWTWRYFFQKPNGGGIICVCSFVYGDKDRAKAQEDIIAKSLTFTP